MDGSHIQKPLQVVICSSSDFVLSIVEDVYQKQGIPLMMLVEAQFTWLLANCPNKASYHDAHEALLQTHLPELFQSVQLATIITQPSRELRGVLISNPVAKWATKHNVSLFTPIKLNKELNELVNLVPHIDIGIVASYGQILSQAVLDMPRFGLVNWHPSALSLYRGPTPMQSALADGKAQTALSWIEMTKGMDSGPVLLQIPHHIPPQVTFHDLAKSLSILGSQTWAIVLALQIFHRSQPQFKLMTQNETEATFTAMLTKENRMVNPLTNTALEIFNHWRAYIQYPGTALKDSSYFSQIIKIIHCDEPKESFIYDISNKSSPPIILFEDETWLQTKHGKETKTYLKCANNTKLAIAKISLENGKQHDFRGYDFRDQL